MIYESCINLAFHFHTLSCSCNSSHCRQIQLEDFNTSKAMFRTASAAHLQFAHVHGSDAAQALWIY